MQVQSLDGVSLTREHVKLQAQGSKAEANLRALLEAATGAKGVGPLVHSPNFSDAALKCYKHTHPAELPMMCRVSLAPDARIVSAAQCSIVPLNGLCPLSVTLKWHPGRAAPLQTWKENAADGQRQPLSSTDNVQQGHGSSVKGKTQADAAIQTEQDTRLPR